MKQRRRQNQGQVGMTVLLIMVVMVTVAVAVAGRSVSNLNLTRREQESTRSLDLAESGIEQLLSDLSGVDANQTYKVVVQNKEVFITTEPITGIDHLQVKEGHTVEVLLDDGTAQANQINISWTGACPDSQVIEVTLLKFDAAANTYHAQRTAYDDSVCSVNNGFTAEDPSTGVDLDVDGYKLARIKVLGAETTLTVTGDLPNQGIIAKASASETSDVTSTVQKYQYRGSLPTIFDYVVFSGESIN